MKDFMTIIYLIKRDQHFIIKIFMFITLYPKTQILTLFSNISYFSLLVNLHTHYKITLIKSFKLIKKTKIIQKK